MFLQASVCLQEGKVGYLWCQIPFLVPGPMPFLGGRVSHIPYALQGITVSRARVSRGGKVSRGVRYPAGRVSRSQGIPLIRYTRKVGGTHPTRMLYC